MYMCTYVYMHVCTYIHIHVHTCITYIWPAEKPPSDAEASTWSTDNNATTMASRGETRFVAFFLCSSVVYVFYYTLFYYYTLYSTTHIACEERAHVFTTPYFTTPPTRLHSGRGAQGQ